MADSISMPPPPSHPWVHQHLVPLHPALTRTLCTKVVEITHALGPSHQEPHGRVLVTIPPTITTTTTPAVPWTTAHSPAPAPAPVPLASSSRLTQACPTCCLLVLHRADTQGLAARAHPVGRRGGHVAGRVAEGMCCHVYLPLRVLQMQGLLCLLLRGLLGSRAAVAAACPSSPRRAQQQQGKLLPLRVLWCMSHH